MDIGNATGAPVVVDVDGKPTEFGRLSMSDFGKLQGMIELDAGDPRGSRAFITMFDTYNWCTTAAGTVPFLLTARQKIDSKATAASIEAMGKPLALYAIANKVMNATVLSDEDAEDDGAEDTEGNAEAPADEPQTAGTG